MCKTGSNISVHAWRNNHSIDFNNARVTNKGNFRIRETLESWHTANTNDADINSKPLPKQYSIFLDQCIFPFTVSTFFFTVPFCIYFHLAHLHLSF